MVGRVMFPIPVEAAEHVAKAYGYDQVVIIARRVSDPDEHEGGEHVTTYGRNAEHCGAAARVGNFIKHRIMGWPEDAGAAALARDTGFSDGVILALQVMASAGNAGSASYEELLRAAGAEQVGARAKAEGMWKLAGLDRSSLAGGNHA
jgi:hypothetical protein